MSTLGVDPEAVALAAERLARTAGAVVAARQGWHAALRRAADAAGMPGVAAAAHDCADAWGAFLAGAEDRAWGLGRGTTGAATAYRAVEDRAARLLAADGPGGGRS